MTIEVMDLHEEVGSPLGDLEEVGKITGGVLTEEGSFIGVVVDQEVVVINGIPVVSQRMILVVVVMMMVMWTWSLTNHNLDCKLIGLNFLMFSLSPFCNIFGFLAQTILFLQMGKFFE